MLPGRSGSFHVSRLGVRRGPASLLHLSQGRGRGARPPLLTPLLEAMLIRASARGSSHPLTSLSASSQDTRCRLFPSLRFGGTIVLRLGRLVRRQVPVRLPAERESTAPQLPVTADRDVAPDLVLAPAQDVSEGGCSMSRSLLSPLFTELPRETV
jgi:hypothetical protein